MQRRMKKQSAAKKKVKNTYNYQLLLIGLLVSALYVRTTHFDFVGLDDNILIKANYKYIKNIGNFFSAFSHDVFYNPTSPSSSSGFYYRPLVTVSLMIDAQFSNQNPGFYHFTNILIHLFCCLLLVRFLLVYGYSSQLAFLGGLILAVHPMLSQAVGWIPGRNDSMLTLCILASLIFYKNYVDTGNTKRLFLHLLFFLSALFTKETAIFLPIVSFFWYFLIHLPQDKIQVKFREKNFVRTLAGYLVIGLIWFFMRKHVVAATQADLSPAHLLQTFISNFPVYFQLLQKMIFPYNLSIMSVAADTNYLIALPLIALVILLLVFSKGKSKAALLWGFAWFNVFLLPSFLVPILTGFEHRAYLPMIGFLLMLFEIDFMKNLDFRKKPALVAVIAAILIFSLVNTSQTGAFANNFRFWEKASENSPHSALAKLNYGAALVQQGRKEDALRTYWEGLKINPNEPMIHNNIAVVYTGVQQFDSAKKEFAEEIRVNPAYADAYYNLGVTYEKLRDTAQMISNWQKALEINPHQQLARRALEKATHPPGIR